MSNLGERITPFRGLLYNRDIVGEIAKVVAPPYDIIDQARQQELYDRSPYNIVRIELNRDQDRYASAEATLTQWLADGVLRRADRPAIYHYSQSFEVGGAARLRTGFVVRYRLEEFARGKILPHEKTFPAAKEDRLKLLSSTRTNISSIFGLYSGAPELEGLRDTIAARPATIDLIDDLGIRNQLRAFESPEEIATIQKALAPSRILIADGHHRYETALNYARQTQPSGNGGAGYVMMALVGSDDPGLVILPTHRIVRRLRPEAIASFKSAADTFAVEEVSDRAKLGELLRGARHGTIAVALREHDKFFSLRLRDHDILARLLPDVPAEVRNLDVTLLHTLVFDRIFSLKAAEIRKGGNVEYTIDADAALDAVREGRADGAFLMNPPTIRDVERVSDAGATMPQKSTYFYPKLLTGLVMNPLDD